MLEALFYIGVGALLVLILAGFMIGIDYLITGIWVRALLKKKEK